MRSKAKAGQFSDVISKKTKGKAAGKDKTSRHKLFVGGLSVKVTDSQLRKHMQQYGEIHKVSIIKKDGISKGFGFITFTDLDAAQIAVETTHTLEGKSFNCKFILSDTQAKKMMLDEKERKIYLKGLSKVTTTEVLFDYFSYYGDVERAVVNRNMDETSKGTGFILFHSKSTVEYLLNRSTHCHTINGKECKIFECLLKREIDLHAQQKQIYSEPAASREDEVYLLRQLDINGDADFDLPSDFNYTSHSQNAKKRGPVEDGIISTERSSNSNNERTASLKEKSNSSCLDSQDLLDQIAQLSKQWEHNTEKDNLEAEQTLFNETPVSSGYGLTESGCSKFMSADTPQKAEAPNCAKPSAIKQERRICTCTKDLFCITSSSWRSTLISYGCSSACAISMAALAERTARLESRDNYSFRIEGLPFIMN